MAGCSLINEAVQDDGGTYRGTFCRNGLVFAACGGGGLAVYRPNGAGLDLLDAINDGGSYWSVWVNTDSTRVFVADFINGLRMYSWDGANLVLLDTDDQGGFYEDVWSDGTYIYVANGTLGIMAYAVVGNALNHLVTRLDGTTCYGVDGDGTYIYTASGGAIPGVKAYTFNGAAFAYIATAHDGVANYWDLVFRDGYVYCACDGDGIRLYTFNGVAFAHIAQYDEPVGTAVLSIGTDGYYIYSVVENLGLGDDYIRAYSFDGAALALEYSIQHPMMVGGVGPRRFNTGNATNFLYLPAGDNGVRIVTALYADFSIDDNALFGTQTGQLTAHCGLPEGMGVWAYDFDDGTVSALKNPTKSYSSSGTYTITMTVTRGGLTETHSIVVGVGGASAIPGSGNAPLDVQFTYIAPTTVSDNVQWQWDFGDGSVSTEQNPTHQYTMPGEYVVTLTVWDVNGNMGTVRLTIYVYDFDYSGNVPNTSITTVCYRTPVRANEGSGVSEYRDTFTPGLNWIWPPALLQIGMGYDLQKREIALVLDAKTQREYQINDFTAWKDRLGPYGGTAFRSWIWQRAHQSMEGEHVPIRHIEHHEYFKSFDRQAFQNAVGYDSEGLPLDMEVENQLFQDGEAFTPIVRARRIPIHGDLVFQEKVEARNLQLRTSVLDAPYLLTGIVPYYETVDKQSSPALRRMTETTYQNNIASMPLFHVSRNFNPILNLATSANVSVGTNAGTVTGPDGRLYSAVRFGAAHAGFGDTAVAAIVGSFSAYLWTTNILLSSLPVNLIVLDNLTVRLTNAAGIHLMEIIHGAQTFNVGITFRGTSWTMFTIVRNGLSLMVYENKTLLDTFALAFAMDQGTNVVMGDGNTTIFDPCIVPRALTSEDIDYYYDDVIRGGEQVLQPF